MDRPQPFYQVNLSVLRKLAHLILYDNDPVLGPFHLRVEAVNQGELILQLLDSALFGLVLAHCYHEGFEPFDPLVLRVVPIVDCLYLLVDNIIQLVGGVSLVVYHLLQVVQLGVDGIASVDFPLQDLDGRWHLQPPCL